MRDPDLPIDVDDLIARIDRPDGEPLDLLTDAVFLSGQLGELADDVVDHFVKKAREAGASWAEVGRSIGVSKQAAQKRFVKGRGWRRPGKGGLFTRFAGDARIMVRQAVANAEELGSDEVNTLHLVMALAAPESGSAYRAIAGLSTSADEVVDAARDAVGGPSGSSKKRHLPFAADAKKVLQLALRETIRLGSRPIETGHVLLGLLRDEESPGARILNQHGVSHEGAETWLDENGLL